MAIKNVVFDLGGVMVKYDPRSFVTNLGFDKETEDSLCDAIFRDQVWHDLDMGLYMTYTDALPAFISRHPDLEKEIREFFTPNWMNLYELKKDTEKELYDWVYDKGLNIYILSNYSADGFTFIKNKYSFFKKARGYVVSAFEKCMKPDPKIYRILLERFNLVPEQSVFIDDYPENIEGARKLGMKGIVFKGVEDAKNELKKLGV